LPGGKSSKLVNFYIESSPTLAELGNLGKFRKKLGIKFGNLVKILDQKFPVLSFFQVLPRSRF